MKYHELNIKNKTARKRVGRGIAAGQGKTAGRGTKGQKARAGWSKNPGFAGGQNPLMQQLPKLPGFKSHRAKVINVFTNQLNNLKTSDITSETLADAGLISSPYSVVKVLFRGEVTKKLTVRLPLASANAKTAIESSNGSFVKTDRLARPASQKRQI